MKKIKLEFNQLMSELQVLTKEEMVTFFGGSGDPGMCFFDMASYLLRNYSSLGMEAGTGDDYFNYYMNEMDGSAILYDRWGNMLGVSMSHQDTIDTYGQFGLSVSGYSNGIGITTDLMANQSSRVVFAFITSVGPNNEQLTHAVEITGVNPNGGYDIIDPQGYLEGPIDAGMISVNQTYSIAR